MWAIIQYNKKFLGILNSELKKKTDDSLKIYIPKISLKIYKKNKFLNKEINILNDYMFCYHSYFCNRNFFLNLMHLKGLKNILMGYQKNQKEINEFVQSCKNSEDKNGNVSKNFYKLILKSNYKFVSGPFMNQVFKLIGIQKKNIELLIGNIKLSINKKVNIFNPVN